MNKIAARDAQYYNKVHFASRLFMYNC